MDYLKKLEKKYPYHDVYDSRFISFIIRTQKATLESMEKEMYLWLDGPLRKAQIKHLKKMDRITLTKQRLTELMQKSIKKQLVEDPFSLCSTGMPVKK